MSDSKQDGVVVEKPQEQENTAKQQGSVVMETIENSKLTTPESEQNAKQKRPSLPKRGTIQVKVPMSEQNGPQSSMPTFGPPILESEQKLSQEQKNTSERSPAQKRGVVSVPKAIGPKTEIGSSISELKAPYDQLIGPAKAEQPVNQLEQSSSIKVSSPQPPASAPPKVPRGVRPQMAKSDQERKREEREAKEERELDRRMKEAKVRAKEKVLVIELSPEIQDKIDNMREMIQELKKKGEMDLVKANEQKLQRGISKFMFERAKEMEKEKELGPDNPGANKWVDEKGERKNQVSFSEKKEVHTYPRLIDDPSPEAPTSHAPEAPAPKSAFTDPRPHSQKGALPKIASQPSEGPASIPSEETRKRFAERFSGEDWQQLNQIRENTDVGSMRRDVSPEGRRLTLVPMTPRHKDHAPTAENLPPPPPTSAVDDEVNKVMQGLTAVKKLSPAFQDKRSSGMRRNTIIAPLNQSDRDGGRSM